MNCHSRAHKLRVCALLLEGTTIGAQRITSHKATNALLFTRHNAFNPHSEEEKPRSLPWANSNYVVSTRELSPPFHLTGQDVKLNLGIDIFRMKTSKHRLVRGLSGKIAVQYFTSFPASRRARRPAAHAPHRCRLDLAIFVSTRSAAAAFAAAAAVSSRRRRSRVARVAASHVAKPRDSARNRHRPASAVRRCRAERRAVAPARHLVRPRRRGAAEAWARARASAMPSRAKSFQWATTFSARRLRRSRRRRC